MAEKKIRELTNLEYIVLGLISIQPHSGYDIVNYFEENMYSWSASPGSIYPMLKRLEKQEVIDGNLEFEHETRPRKIYQLTELGGKLLDQWLVLVPRMRPFYEQREIGMLRFQFMEHRLSKVKIIQWLDNYLDAIRVTDAHRETVHSAVQEAMKEYGLTSVHPQLIMESTMMDLNTLRTWLEMAKQRLTAVAIQTGEYHIVETDDGKSK